MKQFLNPIGSLLVFPIVMATAIACFAFQVFRKDQMVPQTGNKFFEIIMLLILVWAIWNGLEVLIANLYVPVTYRLLN